MILEGSKELNGDYMLPIAWGYLRPVGCSNIHTGPTKVQLYRYKSTNPQFATYSKEIDPLTPDILLEFNWHRREKYPSFLDVELTFTSFHHQHEILCPPLIGTQPWHIERSTRSFELQKKEPGHQISARVDPAKNVKDKLDHTKTLLRWERGVNEPCKCPDHCRMKFDSEALGCFKLKFSNSGKYLAAACTMPNSLTIIKIFDVETAEHIISLKVHYDIVHDLSWSPEDTFLLSSSADTGVKSWNLYELHKGNRLESFLKWNENDKLFYMCTLLHPSYVYGAQYFPSENVRGGLVCGRTTVFNVVATVCYDQNVRLWGI